MKRSIPEPLDRVLLPAEVQKKTMKELLKVIWDWFVKSSADPQKTSLTIKGVLSTAVLILGYLGITGHGIDVNDLTKNTTDLIVLIPAAVTTLVTAWGLVRKIALTIIAFSL